MLLLPHVHNVGDKYAPNIAIDDRSALEPGADDVVLP